MSHIYCYLVTMPQTLPGEYSDRYVGGWTACRRNPHYGRCTTNRLHVNCMACLVGWVLYGLFEESRWDVWPWTMRRKKNG